MYNIEIVLLLDLFSEMVSRLLFISYIYTIKP